MSKDVDSLVIAGMVLGEAEKLDRFAKLEATDKIVVLKSMIAAIEGRIAANLMTEAMRRSLSTIG